MHPAKRRRNRKIFVWIAAVVSFTAVLSVSHTQGRLLNWASADVIYTPAAVEGYSSNCLVSGGQQIIVTDWKPEETERVITIAVRRPEQELTEIIQEISEVSAPVTTEETIPEVTEEIDVQTTESTAPEMTEETKPEATWPTTEVAVTMDDLANVQLIWDAQIDEDSIQVCLKRREDAPGLQQTAQLTVHVAWHGLEGTICMNMLPYGTAVDQETVGDSEMKREITADLEPVYACDTMNPDAPVTCLKLNLDTQSDFMLTFYNNGHALNMVRWSLDGGQSYSLLYDSNQLNLSWPYLEGWDGTVFFDFSQALGAEQKPTIAVEATGYQREEFIPVYQALPMASDLIVKSSDFPHTITICTGWGGAQMQPQQIQRMIADEEKHTYQEDSSMTVVVTENGLRLELSQEDILPISGSYRMLVHWVWNDIPIQEQIIYFFVNTN